MLSNYHTHTYRCMHANGEDREYVETAIKNGIKVLGFSDHCPWIFDDAYESGIRMRPSQTDDYFHSLTELKKEYEMDIKIYIGFESEYIPELIEKQNQFLKDYPVDYMILGEHYTEREPFGRYMGIPSDNESVLQKYVDTIIEGMNTGKYAYVAHPDLFLYNGSYEIYEKHYRRLCEYLKAHSIPIEINLLGVQQYRHYPNEKFLSIAGKVGNTAIIGYDAHTPEALTDKECEKKCIELAEKFGLKLMDFLPELGLGTDIFDT